MAFIHTSGLHHTFQWSSSRIISGIEWPSSGPYFDGLFLVGDITFHSVFRTRNVQCVEQHTHQISLTYTPYLPVNRGDSVPKRSGSAILDKDHCSGPHSQPGVIFVRRRIIVHINHGQINHLGVHKTNNLPLLYFISRKTSG